jgi:Phage shock protein A (IM30), suppresses sigma54-dependent transcription
MAQTTILGRVGQLLRANINSMLDGAEDPEKMLDQLVRDFTNNMSEAEDAVAQTIGNLRMVEDDAKEAHDAAADWGNKAVAASKKADELRAAGNTSDADKFDSLAKLALGRQISFENQVKTFDTQIAQQTALVDQLKDGLNKMRVRRDELVQKRDELVARAKMAKAQTQVQTTLKNVSVMDPTSELSQYEEKVRRQEAMAQGMAEVNADSVDEQFASLQGDEDAAEVDARLAALKAGS